MNAQHIFENGIYLLNNVAVAKNPLFRDEKNFVRFNDKAHLLLEPICKIIAYAYHENQWELLVKMKTREEFIEFYRKKHGDNNIPSFLIPESTYIFSQEMANLQSGFVKHFNWLNKRVGGLFYRRYQKELIFTSEELVSTVERLNGMSQKNPHKGEWAIKKIARLKEDTKRSSIDVFKGSRDEIQNEIAARLGMKISDLEVQFKFLPPLKIESPIFRYLRQLFKILTFFEHSV